ncbi:MAG TPA: PAS domain S-box protein [Gemmatimonadales bacterium]|nr:PAS domain S-box protein [Gemmatimonadales bacterium]
MSTQAGAAGALDPELDSQVRLELGRAFRARLQGDAWLVLLGHSALVSLVAVLAWNAERGGRLALWVTAVVVTTVARTVWLRRSARPELSDRSVIVGARVMAAAHGLAWGLGAAFVMPLMPMPDIAVMIAVLAGIGAGAVATLAPDARSFYALVTAMAGPLPVGILAAGRDRPHIVALLVVAVFTIVMLVLYRRAHAAFAAQVLTVVHRTRAEAALRESEERFRLLSEAAFEGIAITERGTVIDCNDDLVSMLGYTREEMIGRPVVEFIPPEHAELVRARQQAQATERYEHLMRRKDGSTFPVEAQGRLIPYQGRQLMVTAVRDMTERRRAEEALRHSEARHRRLVEDAVFGIYRSTLDGRFVSANPALVEMLGYASEEEVLARDLARDIYADPAERERLIAGSREAERYEGVEVAWKRKDGTPITVRLSGRPIPQSDGELSGFEMIVEDVTERHALEAQLRQAQKMEAVAQLAGGLAHDLNNLLTAVLASGDLLAAELPPGSPHREDVETIGRAARRGGELTRKLLAFSRKHPLEVKRLSLAMLARDFVRMARRMVPEDVDVDVRVESHQTRIEADPGAIEQILMNLVTNARDAMPAGGKLVIEVGRRALDEEHYRAHGWGTPGEYVTLSVSDTGVGMDAETRQHVFEPFFTTKPPGEGTGLGMSVVYGLVKQHLGFVNVESEPGQGTTVRVYLPAAAGAVTAAEHPPTPAVRGGTETILLVEDEEALRAAATRVLEKHGYTVIAAADGHEALAVMGELKVAPDLILSDVVMPRVSGPQLLSTLRQAGPAPRTLFMSAYASRDLVERKRLEPDLPFLAKPWMLTDLLRKVREVLDAPPRT